MASDGLLVTTLSSIAKYAGNDNTLAVGRTTKIGTLSAGPAVNFSHHSREHTNLSIVDSQIESNYYRMHPQV